MKKQTIIETHQVRKYGDPVSLAMEVEKMLAAQAIGQSSGMFIVPEVLEFDAVRGELTMSRLSNLIPLRQLKGSASRDLSFYRCAGEALAIIHQQLSMNSNSRIDLPAKLDNHKHKCWVHGDYTKQNVGTAMHNGQVTLAIIDWQLSSMYGGNATYGTAIFDIAWFVSGVFLEPPHKQTGQWHMQLKARHFLAGYFKYATEGLGTASTLAYSRTLYQRRREEFASNYSIIRRLGLLPGLIHWKMFLDSEEFCELPVEVPGMGTDARP